jgi:hypothetical protein
MEDFGFKRDDENENFTKIAKKALLGLATLLSIFCFIYITINAYYFVYDSSENEKIEIITASKGLIKIYPDNNEIESENLIKIDRSIYDDIFGNNKRKTKAKVRKPLPKKIQVKEESKQEFSSKDLPKIQEPVKKSLPESKNPEIADSYENQQSKSNLKRKVRVQIAAMTSKDSAINLWKKIFQKDPDLFENLKPIIEKIDLKKRGIFYRLQIGDFFNQIEAENFCEKYIKKNSLNLSDCIIVE